MFRTQANPMDDAVVKATDENLTSENWEYIIDVCDRVSASASGPTQAIAALIKRLAHRNANVQLYTLELANALSQNCGPALHRELASKAFTDALLRLAADRNTHSQVKAKVLERMANWTEEFKNSPELGIMAQAFGKLRLQQPGLASHAAPSKPVKREISSEDRRKEEEELQMALALSVQDRGGSSATTEARREEAEAGTGAQQQQQPQGTTAATVSRVRALYDFTPSEAGELQFKKGDIIAVLESVYKDWWKGSLRGATGIFPLNYVEKLQDPTKEELERDAQMEAEVFGEIKNVEKLLALLSVSADTGGRRGEREEEEIGELYQRTLSIRPKLIELIGKYSQKKDDFTQLNEKFIKARRDYEHLLENSMSTTSHYQQQYAIRPRQPVQPMYPPHQQVPHQQPYAGPPRQQQQYPPQGPPPSQSYPPQAPFGAQSQQHLPPQPDPQRFYSPGSSEAPPPVQSAYASSQYQQQPNSPASAGPPPNGIGAAPAPFHFIPGGLQGPPPSQPQQQPLQSAAPPQEQAIRRKPSPQGPPNGSGVGADAYGGATPVPFQGQIRPNSIHTLNSGNPQELATGGYESPVDNRHSYPSIHQQPPPQQQQGMYDSAYAGAPPGQQYQQQQQQQPYPQEQNLQTPTMPYQQPQHVGMPPPQPQQQAPLAPQQLQQSVPRSDRDALPSRQRTQSFETPTSIYSQHTLDNAHEPSAPGPAYQAQQPAYAAAANIPQQPNAPPPAVPESPVALSSVPAGGPYGGGYQAYQAYHPGGAGQAPPPQQQRMATGSSAGDPNDFYR